MLGFFKNIHFSIVTRSRLSMGCNQRGGAGFVCQEFFTRRASCRKKCWSHRAAGSGSCVTRIRLFFFDLRELFIQFSWVPLRWNEYSHHREKILYELKLWQQAEEKILRPNFNLPFVLDERKYIGNSRLNI